MNSNVKKELDYELRDEHFSSKKTVLEKACQPVALKERVRDLWNKEIEIPVVPLATSIVIALTMTVVPYTTKTPQPKSGIVEIDGSYYWQDRVEELRENAD
ncbi:hypothetical protein [Halobacillus salinus]|uniref:hypothetical protein n=1 Tax=Halobacillus salinus TaxID=192814 RepID=UPI0009A82740|nr:hypothetical protein [Halobacillus salinus]